MKPLELAIQIAKEAGNRAAKAHSSLKDSAIKKKEDSSLVTNVDIELNEFIYKEISKQFPDHNIYSEELDEVKNGSDFVWVIDPIDGTRLYTFGLPLYGIAIALMEKGEPILSVINLPELDKLIVAEKGKGATVNGKRMQVADAVPLKESVILGGPGRSMALKNKRRVVLRGDILKAVSSSRHFGVITVDTLLVATGKVNGAIYSHLKDYDAFPNVLIINEAGGVTINEDGEPWQSGDKLMIAGHPDWVSQIVSLHRK